MLALVKNDRFDWVLQTVYTDELFCRTTLSQLTTRSDSAGFSSTRPAHIPGNWIPWKARNCHDFYFCIIRVDLKGQEKSPTLDSLDFIALTYPKFPFLVCTRTCHCPIVRLGDTHMELREKWSWRIKEVKGTTSNLSSNQKSRLLLKN